LGPQQTARDPWRVEVERRRLIGLAYRMLGTVSDAEDAVQETFLRWYRLDEAERAAANNQDGWFTRVTSRICLDVLGSARVRRETYVGEWLPEPLPAGYLPAQDNATRVGSGTAENPADRVTLDESISSALLVVLEAMTPAERVAFVLHDVFAFTFEEIGGIVGRSPTAARQLASSARRPSAPV
jgi:RNA polymerase sigma factor (sigma-70 family)